MRVVVDVFSCSRTGALTLVNPWEARLFNEGDTLSVGEQNVVVKHSDARVGVVLVEPPPDPTFAVPLSVEVETTWHPDVYRALYIEDGAPTHERIGTAAARAMEHQQRVRCVSVSPMEFTRMTRQLGARIEHDERTEVTWMTLMTVGGPVRVIADGAVANDDISLNVSERARLYTTDRSKQNAEHLRRRAELELEDAEELMLRAQMTRDALSKVDKLWPG